MKDVRLIRSKLQAPTYTGPLVARPQLIQRLDALCSRKLALVHAPAGYGKTTLVVQWRERLETQDNSVAWLSLDADDNEVLRFLTYLLEALQNIESALAVDLVSVLETQSANAVEFVLSDLINGIDACGRQLFFVLEDWHLIDSAEVHAAMNFLLTHAPANLHWMITSRKQPDLPLARLRVEDQLVEIEAADLRFDANESREFLQRLDNLRLPAESLDLLWRRTDGWAAALQLASLSLQSADDPKAWIRGFSGYHRSIDDYLAENVLDTLPAPTLDFLLRTSILGRFNGQLCEAVSGHANSQAMLEALERQDLFIRALDPQRAWFRYHHLFAAHLQRRLQRDLPNLEPALHRAASDWYEANGHPGEAVSHALAAGDTERAIELVDIHAMGLVEHSRMASLLALVKKLPGRELADKPQLQMAIAWAHCLTHYPGPAQANLDILQHALSSKHQANHAQLESEARVLQACIDIYADRIDRVEEMVAPVLSHPEAHRAWVVAVAANLRSYGYIHRFKFDAARETQVWAQVYHLRTDGPFSGIYGRFFSGLADACQGNLRAAARQFRETLNHAHDTIGSHSHAARLASALWGQINYEYNDLSHAEQLLEESRALGAEGGVADFSMNTYVPLARLRALQGDVAGAHALLDEGAATAEQLNLARLAAAIDAERVRRYLTDGDLLHAQRLVRASAPLPRDANGIDVQVYEFRELACARVLHAQGAVDEEVKILERLFKSACRHGRRLSEITLRVRLAMAWHDLGRTYDAQGCLFEALVLGASQGMVRSFLDEGPAVTTLLERMRDDARHGESHILLTESVANHINRLIALGKHEQCGDSALTAAANMNSEGASLGLMVEPLKHRELEIVHLLGKGCSNKEIARNLNVSVDTVKWYLKSTYSKLDVCRRSQAVAEAKRQGLIN